MPRPRETIFRNHGIVKKKRPDLKTSNTNSKFHGTQILAVEVRSLLKVKLMSKMKILHIKELILLIILVKQNHSTHIDKKMAAI